MGLPDSIEPSRLSYAIHPGAVKYYKEKGFWTPEHEKRQQENLKKIEGDLSDPQSKASEQPAYVDPEVRSIKPQILILVGLCTHLGCSPTFRPEVAPVDLGPKWVGGYFCPCHGSHYDLAGRVYKSQPAPLNLPVPPHSYESDEIVVIGVDQEKA